MGIFSMLFPRKAIIWTDKSKLRVDVIVERLEKIGPSVSFQNTPYEDKKGLERHVRFFNECKYPTGHEFSVHEFNIFCYDLTFKLKKKPDCSVVTGAQVRRGPSGLTDSAALTTCLDAFVSACTLDREHWEFMECDCYNGILFISKPEVLALYDSLFVRYRKCVEDAQKK